MMEINLSSSNVNDPNKLDFNDFHNLAPLNQLQEDSFLELAEISVNRPMPIEVPLNDPVNVAHKVSLSSFPTPGSTDHILSKGFSKLGLIEEKVETAQQFYSWFSKIEEEMEKLDGERYTQQLEVLKSYQQFCSTINKDLKNSLDSLNKLEAECVSVTTRTNALHDACEQLLSDQKDLVTLVENVEENLEYFLEYESINKYLSSTNLIVTGENFLSTLQKIDSCMDFMLEHTHYKESKIYLEKYQNCLIQALNMIKNYTISSLENSTKNILSRKDEATSVDEDAFTLYYGKFRSNAPKIRCLMEELEKRTSKSPYYQKYLSEIHTSYFNQRQILLAPSVTSTMEDLLKTHQKDHCALVRSSCSFMLHVCEDEHQLFSHFFTLLSPQLHQMLVNLCVNLYDILRPLIIHIYHLETLAELCMILKTEMIDDHVHSNSDQLQAFHQVVSQMLQDVQERLVFRSNIYIRDEIRGYLPSSGDLAYPEKLEMMEKIAQEVKKEEEKMQEEEVFTDIKLSDDESKQNLIDGRFDGSMYTSPADIHGMWFPSVRRVLLCLSKLYRCIDKTIFQGLSQEALQACIQSLTDASKQIINGGKGNKKTSKIVDGQLFLIKHLLILREQITPFQAEFIIRETQLDFSSTKDAALKFVSNPRDSFPNILAASSHNSILKLMLNGAPSVKELYVDSKKDVDRYLKDVCEEFIEEQTRYFSSSLTSFINQANRYMDLKADGEVSEPVKSDLSQQSFAKAELLHELITETYRNLKINLKQTLKSLSLYLANKETEHILFKPIKAKIQQAFHEMNNLVDENYTEEEKQIIATPTPEQVGLLITSIMQQ